MPPKGSKKRKAAEPLVLDEENYNYLTYAHLLGRVICGSPEMIEIFVGEERETFSIHRDLLAIHTSYFEDRLQEENKIEFPDVKPAIFADLHSWLYTGDFLWHAQCLSTTTTGDERWSLGSTVRIRGFQNSAMVGVIEDARDEENHWLYVHIAEFTYGKTQKGDLLRRFTADVISSESPFAKLKPGSQERRDWEDLVTRIPDLAVDVALAGRNWGAERPWDEEFRQVYMEKTPDLEKAWKDLILKRRSREEIEVAAEEGCYRSKLELAHLELIE